MNNEIQLKNQKKSVFITTLIIKWVFIFSIVYLVLTPFQAWKTYNLNMFNYVKKIEKQIPYDKTGLKIDLNKFKVNKSFETISVNYSDKENYFKLIVKILFSTVNAGFFSLFLFIMLKIFKSINLNSVFSLKNVTRIKQLSLIVVLSSIVSIFDTFLTSKPYFSDWLKSELFIDIFAVFITQLHYFVFALILFSLAEVFKQGLLLKEDNDLHI